MPIKISDFPQNAVERQVFDAAYCKHDSWTRVAVAILPILPLGPFWWQLRDLLGPEGAVGLVVIVQLAAMVTIPDRIMMFRALRALKAFRATQNVDVEEAAPTASFRPENYRQPPNM